MRFRVWNKKSRRWESGSLINENGTVFLCETYHGLRLLDQENLIIQEFTGLKDKNGKEIFGGDMVELLNDESERWGVVYYAPAFCLEKNGWIAGFPKPIDTKVIGNIFENLELI